MIYEFDQKKYIDAQTLSNAEYVYQVERQQPLKTFVGYNITIYPPINIRENLSLSSRNLHYFCKNINYESNVNKNLYNS